MRVQKREEEAKFQAMLEEKKAAQKQKSKNLKMNLFGEEAFKKKETGQNDFILPPEYSEENEGDQFQVDFFNSNNHKAPRDNENH